MSSSQPLLDGQIEPDETAVENHQTPSNTTRPPVVLTPTTRENYATSPSNAESGIAGIFKASSHPLALFALFIFRIGAIAVYLLSGFVTDNYVLAVVVVVVLLSMDFWNCRNVAGRTLVGLRFWNQVDDDGESYWVFESRDPSHPVNAIDSRMFWIAIYVFPVLWIALFIVSLLRLKLEFVPIVLLALVFNVTNAIGFTYADRDAKQRWASSVVSSSWSLGFGGIGSQLLSGAVQKGVGRVFGA
ncbi:Golgi apparatus membrane protein TVP23 [Mycena indigotica]|uniref:Golgi apparatus membrane protein TVP23 n=1 Tax=Mycena indigotica TaxID=2126181 RepID=A0A8H6W9D8_9AGAR|nr:Golgi apparatus membrane protein TVP23 [Mycena indigotica]KAF7309602.1 Golgi apparatus membrane protein TVP23 [Mycena indigotica]